MDELGLKAPKGTAANIQARLPQETVDILCSAVAAKFICDRFITSEIRKWDLAVKMSGRDG